MKTRSLLPVLMVIFTLSVFSPASLFAQGPPPWAPAHGYRAKVRHIYFPDYNFYFDLQRNVYIYLSGSNWEVSVGLPVFLSSVNLSVATKVQLELNSDMPQKYNTDHIRKYHGNAGGYKEKRTTNVSGGRNKTRSTPNGSPGNSGKGHGNSKGHGKKK